MEVGGEGERLRYRHEHDHPHRMHAHREVGWGWREITDLLHRHERDHLHQVVLHHVSHDAVLVEVARAALDADVLLEDHLQDQGDSVGVGEGEGW